MTRIRAQKPVEVEDQVESPDVESSSGNPVDVGAFVVCLYYRTAPPAKDSRYNEVRHYYCGALRIGWVGINKEGFRLFTAEKDCLTRVRDLPDEAAVHEFLINAFQ